MKLMIREIPIKEIKLPIKALKEHPDHQIEQIANSIKEFGFNDPIAIDEDGEIIEGQGRILAAKKLKQKKVPAIVLAHLTEIQKRAYRIAHNKTCLNTGFDLDVLRDEFEVLMTLDESVLAFTGFEEIEIHDLLTPPEIPDLAPELTDALDQAKKVTCPHCGGLVYV